MNTKNKTKFSFTAFLFFFLLATGALLMSPQKTSAFWGFGDIVNDPAATVQRTATNISAGTTATGTMAKLGIETKRVAKDVLTEIAKSVAQKALQEMTKSTINWINTGFHGAPLFLENPDSFFKDIAKYEIRTLVDLYGYDTLKFPFGQDFALGVIDAYKSKLEDNSAYTLSKVINDPIVLKNYQANFNYGGWEWIFNQYSISTK